jgi:hypothetical protein
METLNSVTPCPAQTVQQGFWLHAVEHSQIYRSFATTVPQLKISDFSGEMFKGFKVLYFSMSAMTTQLLSSG